MVPVHSEDFIPFMETKSRYRYMLLCRHTEHLCFDRTTQISENARPMCAFSFFDFTEKTMCLQTCDPITMRHWRCSRTKKNLSICHYGCKPAHNGVKVLKIISFLLIFYLYEV